MIYYLITISIAGIFLHRKLSSLKKDLTSYKLSREFIDAFVEDAMNELENQVLLSERKRKNLERVLNYRIKRLTKEVRGRYKNQATYIKNEKDWLQYEVNQLKELLDSAEINSYQVCVDETASGYIKFEAGTKAALEMLSKGLDSIQRDVDEIAEYFTNNVSTNPNKNIQLIENELDQFIKVFEKWLLFLDSASYEKYHVIKKEVS